MMNVPGQLLPSGFCSVYEKSQVAGEIDRLQLVTVLWLSVWVPDVPGAVPAAAPMEYGDEPLNGLPEKAAL
jgi:hypothetical protein